MFHQIPTKEVPGRREPLENFFTAVRRHSVVLTGRLTSREEISRKSPDCLASVQEAVK